MLNLPYGLKNPQNGDLGSVVFPAMNANITQLDAHNHNGTNSPLLGPASSVAATQAIASGSWVATTNGNYRQAVTLVGLDYDKIQVSIKTSSGHQVFPKIEKISTTQYYVYTNDNSVGFTAVYTS